jgi:hypothetical protein
MMIVFHLGVDYSITTADNDTLEEEIKINRDILKQNFVDNYQNLTSNISLNNSLIHRFCSVKSAFMLNWSNNYFRNKNTIASYLVKGNYRISNYFSKSSSQWMMTSG